MKVDIGPYGSGIDGYAFYHWFLEKRYKKPHWILRRKDLDKVDLFIEKASDIWFDILNATINKLLLKRKRKIKVRIDDYDAWSADHTLALIILPLLKKVRDSKQGAPNVDDEDVPEELRSTSAPPKENEWDTDENWIKRWDYVMNEMIHAFKCTVDDDWDSQFHSGKHDYKLVESDREFDGDKTYTVEFGPNHTHVFDKEAYDKAWERRNNGMKLFGKYYHALWS
jgi:hypothetical protein